MKRTLLFFVLVANFSSAQNLVLNPSFEQYDHLPPDRWVNPIIGEFYCNHWTTPKWSSPDYYNANSPYPDYSVPNNLFGYYPAKSGKAYVGFVPFYYTGVMEYISGELSEPLIYGKKYKVSYYVCYAGNSSYFYFSKFGLYFSTKKNPLDDNFIGQYPILYQKNKITANIENKNGFIKSDTNWTEISGIYEAKGGEKYFTIGMFYQDKIDLEKEINIFINAYQDNDHNSFSKKEKKYFSKYRDILITNPNFIDNPKYGDEHPAYYFIDDVSVELIK
jgi:hypothetical protein